MEFKEMQRKLYWLGSCSMKMSIEKEIRELQAECKALREYKSVNLDGMPHGNTVGDIIGDKVAKIVDIYDKRIEELGKKLEKQLAEKDKPIYKPTANASDNGFYPMDESVEDDDLPF